jgi:hypothetical protein
MLAISPTSALHRAFGLAGEHPPYIYFAGYDTLLCLFVSPILGWTAGRVAPSLLLTGRWTWVLPAILLIPMIILGPRTAPVPSLPDGFFITGSNEGLGVVLFTLPMCSAIGYLIGMLLLGMRRVLRIGIVVAIGAALFIPCALILHRYERATIESWSKVRSVIDPLGLPFSPDPNFLCAHPTGQLSLLHATVEDLETRVCSKGQLTETGSPQSHRAFTIKKVRILNGPNAGREGWVPSYGLSGER